MARAITSATDGCTEARHAAFFEANVARVLRYLLRRAPQHNGVFCGCQRRDVCGFCCGCERCCLFWCVLQRRAPRFVRQSLSGERLVLWMWRRRGPLHHGRFVWLRTPQHDGRILLVVRAVFCGELWSGERCGFWCKHRDVCGFCGCELRNAMDVLLAVRAAYCSLRHDI